MISMRKILSLLLAVSLIFLAGYAHARDCYCCHVPHHPGKTCLECHADLPHFVAPDVVGMNQLDAEAAIRSAGGVSRITQEYSAVPEGTVVSQDPEAGEVSWPPSDYVDLVVSMGQAPGAICARWLIGGGGAIAIWGDKIVYIYAPCGRDVDLYMYDLATGIERPICTVSGDQRYPAIWGDKIVWEDRRWNPYYGDIYMYDLATGIERPICTASGVQQWPAIWGDKIVWEDWRNGNGDIYMYDLATGIERPICTASARQKFPAIWGDRIVWMDTRHGNYGNCDIYMYDLATGIETRITTNSTVPLYSREGLAIWGDRIVWMDTRHGNYDNYDIYMYDLVTDIETRITTNSTVPAYMGGPAIWEDRIVWVDWRWNPYYGDIYTYDLATETETNLTADLADYKRRPAIWGDKIVWSKNGIYMCASGHTPTGQVVIQPVDETTGLAPVTLTFENVTQAGVTSLTTSSVGPEPPSGFYFGDPPIYYDLTTTALHSPPIKVCIKYDESRYKAKEEEGLVLMHYEDTDDDGIADTWVDVTCTDVMPNPDTVNNVICGCVDHLSPFTVGFQEVIEASVDICPNTLNLKSKGNWMSCYIELPEGYDVNEIDINTVKLGVDETNIDISAALSPTEVGDHDSDGIPDLMVKFDRETVQTRITVGSVEMMISGSLKDDGGVFQGTDTVAVIDKGKEHTDEVDSSSVVY